MSRPTSTRTFVWSSELLQRQRRGASKTSQDAEHSLPPAASDLSGGQDDLRRVRKLLTILSWLFRRQDSMTDKMIGFRKVLDDFDFKLKKAVRNHKRQPRFSEMVTEYFRHLKSQRTQADGRSTEHQRGRTPRSHRDGRKPETSRPHVKDRLGNRGVCKASGKAQKRSAGSIEQPAGRTEKREQGTEVSSTAASGSRSLSTHARRSEEPRTKSDTEQWRVDDDKFATRDVRLKTEPEPAEGEAY